MRLALDTNVLVYAEGLNGQERRDEANDLIQRIPRTSIVVPAQAVAELFNVLVRKGELPRSDARRLTQRWLDSYDIAPTSAATLQTAIGLATEHWLQIFDAMILAAAAEATCGLLFSEDMHDGFVWNGVTVTNPFQAKRHVWLEMLLDEGGAGY